MQFPKVATVINFCSNDYPFLKHCVDAVTPFSHQVLIPICDHFYDEIPEDPAMLNGIYAEFPSCEFIQYPFHHPLMITGCPERKFLPNLARLLTLYYIDSEIDWVLFLDADEIVETSKFLVWLTHFPLDQYDALRLACYWYFRETSYQSLEWEDTPLLVKKAALNSELMMSPSERAGIFDQLEGAKCRFVKGIDQLPFVHHYSWVRSKQQLLRKVASWSHRQERDWSALVEEEFARSFSGQDFVHGYSFKEVVPYIGLDKGRRPRTSEDKPPLNHVHYLDGKDMMRIDLSLRFNL